MKALDPMALPLQGRQLIEASAGTGKTHTICTLVLRLLLGHQGGRTGVEPRSIEEILIMTFTRDATEELRARIRQRLSEARGIFSLEQEPEAEDGVMKGLMAQSADRQQDLNRIERAQADLDLASIVTIHSFARAMLDRHAFESGAPFDVEISPEDAFEVREALLDFWRDRVYPLDPDAATAIQEAWKSGASGFVATARRLLPRSDLRLLGAPAESWRTLNERIASGRRAIIDWWREHGGSARELLTGIPLNKDGRVARERALAALDAGASGVLDRSALAGLDPEFLRAELPKRMRETELPQLALFDMATALAGDRELLGRALLRDALQVVPQRLNRGKAESGSLGYDDLLRLLDAGLDGAGGEQLAHAIRRQYPVALIDEFQDTDPLQWRIFSRIYTGNEPGALFLVGDPKQAIYAFRGADVYAYLGASSATPARYSLDTNYRSVKPLVEAVNALFSLRADQDPFLAGNLIRYRDVRHSGEPDARPLRNHGETVTEALQVLRVGEGELLGLGDYRERMAVAVAAHLGGLLADSDRGEFTLDDRALQPADIACLVRNRDEAALLERELRRRHVPCVYRGRESVYTGEEAHDLYQLLAALLDPGSERMLRAALGCALVGFSAAELDALFVDERALGREQQRFVEAAEAMRRVGPQAVLRRLLFDYQVPARLLAEDRGERRLTNCLHLIELLQAERATLDSDEALLARLAQNIATADGEKEEQQLRLESDARRVRIVTLHSAKGLQYPVVYLPFQAAFREAREPLFHDAASGQVCWDLEAGEQAVHRAERERLAEDMRLLYVGLTRAVHLCVLGVANIRRGNGKSSDLRSSALGYLLGADSVEAEAAISRLGALPGCRLVESQPGVGNTRLPHRQQPVPLKARNFASSIECNWRRSSFTALTRPVHEAEESVFRQPELISDRQTAAGAPVSDIMAFPAGPRHGSFLHSVLERIDYGIGMRGDAEREELARELRRNGYRSEWLSALGAMIDDVLGCALDGVDLRLESIKARDRVTEMRFTMPLAEIDAPRLNALIDPGASMEPLRFSALQGMLSGAMDLVFMYGGRFHVVDFKSNLLGTGLDDYLPDRLDAAMREHRYDVQYLFYTVALQRFLRLKLGKDYDYERHTGGVYYLYLRGMRRSAGNRYGVWYQRPQREQIDALDALFAGGAK